MLKTFKEIRDFNMAADAFARLSPTNMQTKMGYAIKKVTDDSVRKAVTEFSQARTARYYDEVESVQIEQALTDKATGAVLTAPKGSDRPYLYDKKGLRAVLDVERLFDNVTSQAILDEWDEKEFEIHPHYIKEVPGTELDLVPFYGFVVDPDNLPTFEPVEVLEETNNE